MYIKLLLVYYLPIISTESMILGIDVSHWNENINWKKVAQTGVKFAFAKATQGSHNFDPTFVKNWNGIRNNGLIAGAYHYFSSDVSLEDQLNNIRNNIINKVDINSTAEKYLMIDFEENSGKLKPSEMAKLLYSLIQSIDSEFKIKPIIYTTLSFWKSSIDKFANEYPFNDYRLWIANWSTKSPVIPKPWNEYFIWQYTNKGRIDGIMDEVDLNWLKTTANRKFRVKEFKEFKEFDFYSEYKLKNLNSILKFFRIRDNF